MSSTSILFAGKKKVSNQKLRGGYYTPKILSDYMVDWAIRSETDNILEPSCGDGNFIESALNKLNRFNTDAPSSIISVELNREEIQKAKKRAEYINSNTILSWKNDDFFRTYMVLKKKKINVVLGNPPFIRFQHFDNESRELAFSHLRDSGYKPTKLSNTWAAFVQLSIELLSEGGRLAMVVPAEILQVQYASELRQRITQQFEQIILVTFKKLVFPDIQQEVVLLLADNKRKVLNGNCTFHTVEIEDEYDLHNETLEKKVFHSGAKHACGNIKWTSFFLKQEEFHNIYDFNKEGKIKSLKNYAAVNVGIVTGRNKFFILDKEVVSEYKLDKFIIPLVGKTNGLNKLRFTKKDFKSFSLENPAYLLQLQNIDYSKFTKGLKEYIALGEQEDVHLGYKCRIRKRWYDVPSTHISEGFLFRQIYKNPLLVSNKANVACTDTIHRVILKDKDINIEQLSASFINSFTFAWSEIVGRSYGGGVLELEPSEAIELPMPYVESIPLDLDLIDKEIRNNNIEKVLDYVDQKILIEHFGYQKHEVALLRQTWINLRDRRIYRSKSK